jgi:hypothetical protein
MRFHLPSFLIGCAVGAGAVLAYPRVRPVLLEVASATYRFYDALMARLGMAREDVEDFFAEAKSRARAPRPEPVTPAARA